MSKYTVTLTQEERVELGQLTPKGKHRFQKILNGLILLNCDTGAYQKKQSINEETARVPNVSMKKMIG